MKKLLIVEDDQNTLRALTQLLRRAGYAVLCAEDAISAVKMTVAYLPDLIILDLGIPAGGGRSVLQFLCNKLDLTMPVLILSADSSWDSALDVMPMINPISFLQKPAESEELLHQIRAALARSTTE